MSDSLSKRVTRLETGVDAQDDWRQFGSDPRDMPDWALEMAVREEADQFLNQIEVEQPGLPEAGQARVALQAGDLDEAITLILRIRTAVTEGIEDEFAGLDAGHR